MSEVIVKKIALMASHDWTLRRAMAEFLMFVNPTLKWKGQEYKLELTRVRAKPLVVGTDLNKEADLIMDRTTHWNGFYRSWAHQAVNSQARMVNHPYTFWVYDKHSTFDLLSRAMHPRDRFPKTVLLPLFYPWNEDQIRDMWWQYEQQLIMENTEHGSDPARRKTDWEAVRKELAHAQRRERKSQIIREQFNIGGNYLKQVVDEVFEGRFPLYFKKAYGGGGSKVYRVANIDELYYRYDRSGEEAFHLQEAIEPYDKFYRAMGVGPIVFPMIFQPDQPLHNRYGIEKPKMDRDIYYRLQSYVQFVNSYHRWTYNSFETLLRNGELNPIDFANACPDSHFTSLHVHFPLLVCSLLKWLSFCSVTGKDMRIDMEMTRYLNVLNDPDKSAQEKFDFCRAASQEYFETELFQEFCAQNFDGLEDQMIEFYDRQFDDILRFAIEFSDFPDHEHDRFFNHYKNLMETHWRPNAKAYLTPVIYST